MDTKKIVPVELKEISYTQDSRINLGIIGSDVAIQISPNDALDVFHALMQAIGGDAVATDNLFYAIDDALAIPSESGLESIDAAALELINCLAV